MVMQLQTLPIFRLAQELRMPFSYATTWKKIHLGYKKTATVIHLCIPKGSFPSCHGRAEYQ